MINLRVVGLLAASLVTATVATQAQDPAFSPRGDRSAERRSRFEGFMRSMDTNGNGTIEPAEVPAERRRMYEFLASRAGLPAGQPISINQALEAMSQFGRPGGPPGGSAPPPNGAAPQQPNSSSSNPAGASSTPTATPGVPGFGANPTITLVPGFGTSAPVAAGSASATPASAAASTTAATPGSDPRLRGFGESILRRYDRNQNGVLDKDEWGQMRRDPSAADRNQDGQITADELTTWLVERGRERQQSEGSHDHGPGSGFGPPGGLPGMMPGSGMMPGPGMMSGPSASDSPSASSTTSSRKSYRFLTPQERLPAGLPSWFTSQDTNHDGQVSMAEYTRDWSDEKAREFAKFDLNGDGMVTPQECLRSGTVVAQAPSSPSPSSSSGSQPLSSQAPGSQASSGVTAPTTGTSERPKAKSWWMTP